MDAIRKLIDEHQLPLSAPPVDQAWEEMRRMLDEDKPKATPLLPLLKPGYARVVKYLSGAVLLLLLISVSFFIYSPFGNKDVSKPPFVSSSSDQTLKNLRQPATAGDRSTSNSSAINKNDLTINSNKKQMHTDSLTEKSENKQFANLQLKSNTVTVQKNNDREKNIPSAIGDGIINQFEYKSIIDTGMNSDTEGNLNMQVPVTVTSGNLDAVLEMDTNEPKASVVGDAPPHIELPEEKWTISTGLLWTLPVPLYNASNYFIGPNGLSQPYRVLLPGAWIHAEKEKHLMTLEINPFVSSLPPSTVFRTVTTFQNNQDTLVQTKDERSLVKTFGLSAGVGYQYKIISNWWIGAGVQMHYWFRAVAASNAEVQKIPMGGTIGTTTNQSHIYTLTDEWSYFSRMQVSLVPEIIYKTPKWQSGFRLCIPITPLALQDGPKHFLRAEFVYRLKLLDIHLKK